MTEGRNPISHPLAALLCALSLSIGWGVRGNWGHEFGAMIPGALTALAACMLSGREDWRRRAAHFAFFGALGWSFGGSISYMQVIGYTQSGHFPSQIYGFAALWVIGFCWGSMGGAGTALPALLDREKLTGFYAPLAAIFIAWFLQDMLPGVAFSTGSQERFDADLNWFDTDWIAATVALPALVVAMALRRRTAAAWAGLAFMLAAIVGGFLVFDYRFENAVVPPRLAALVILPAIFAFAFFKRPWSFAESLLLWMALGWWTGFVLLVNVLGMRMTPPRGDNWSGCLGMAIAMILCFAVHQKPGAAWASIVAGVVGGLGFSGGQALKLAEIFYFEVGKGYHTNWHSILEQSYGFINGLGIALAMAALATRAPKLADGDSPEPPARPWTDGFAFAFVMIFVTFVNMRKNVESAWVPAKVVPEAFYGHSSQWWFNLAFALLAATILGAMLLNARRPLALLPRSALGRGQLFYLAFLWWIVFANASRDFPFAPQRIVTEGVIHLNACLATLLILGLPREGEEPAIEAKPAFARLALKALMLGLLVSGAAIALQTAAARALFGDKPMPGANLHIRFGPNATLNKR